MRFLLLLFCLGSGSALRGVRRHLEPPPLPKGSVQYDAMWYEQKLDHFDIMNSPTWNQRYWANLDHYVEGGPAMIMIGGEAEASPGWLNYGLWSTLAEESNAAMFLLEHRFYGQSQPTGDMAIENMRFLSSRQALEDLSTFMTSMNMAYNISGPWVSYGGSYPGSLSAWLKLKYPHLVKGAVSSSGPLHAQLDFQEYLGVVHSALDTTGPECMNAISEAIYEIEAIPTEDEAAWSDLSAQFQTCRPIDSTNMDDIRSFAELLIDNLAGVVQYNGRMDLDITAVCDIMRDGEGSALERFALVNSVSLDANQAECLDHEFSSFLALLTDISWSGPGVGWRQWFWQTCTEFGWYQTSNQPDNAFGSLLNLEFFESWCQQAYGDAFTHARLEQEMIDTNTEYGGFTPDVHNVVFVHGTIDPWHAMGVLEDLSDTATAIYIEGTSHCADMYGDSPGDSEDLQDARLKIKEIVLNWVL